MSRSITLLSPAAFNAAASICERVNKPASSRSVRRNLLSFALGGAGVALIGDEGARLLIDPNDVNNAR
jgi:hypothetical protein